MVLSLETNDSIPIIFLYYQFHNLSVACQQIHLFYFNQTTKEQFTMDLVFLLLINPG